MQAPLEECVCLPSAPLPACDCVHENGQPDQPAAQGRGVSEKSYFHNRTTKPGSAQHTIGCAVMLPTLLYI